MNRYRNRDASIYATIFVKRLLNIQASRTTPPHRQNQLSVALFESHSESETGNYTLCGRACQAGNGQQASITSWPFQKLGPARRLGRTHIEASTSKPRLSRNPLRFHPSSLVKSRVWSSHHY
jgi:hypothetical protein